MDESSDKKKATVQTVAGMLAPTDEWNCIWGEWAALLAEYEIPEMHMTYCVAGKGDFKAFSTDDLEEMQWRFLSVILKPGPRIAHATTVFLETYENHRQVLEKRRQFPVKSGGSGKLGDPYYLAFEHSVQEIATDSASRKLSPNEALTFIFDDGPYAGRARKFYDILLAKETEYRDRLGPCTFAQSNRIIPLQIADTIAYEYRRYHEDVIRHRDIRPAIVELAARFGGGWVINAGELRRLADLVDGSKDQ